MTSFGLVASSVFNTWDELFPTSVATATVGFGLNGLSVTLELRVEVMTELILDSFVQS